MKKYNENIKGWLNKVGQSIAGKLNRWINPLSSPAKRIGFLVMGVSIAAACLVLVVQSVQTSDTSSELQVEQITKPQDIYPEEKQSAQESEQRIIAQYNRMIRFKELVEKLTSTSDRKSLDSLMKAHPGLRDSLNTFMETYFSH